MKIGIIGVGHLAQAMLAGFMRSGLPVGDFLLSPRGQALKLAEEQGFALARDNRDLVENCDIVILAVRPKDAPCAVADLPWRQQQTLISVCAGVALKDLAVAPASTVRAMPLTAAEINASPTVCFPPQKDAVALLEHIGPVIHLTSEKAFEVATVNAAVYGWAQNLIRLTAAWSAQELEKFPESVPENDLATMRRLVSLTFAAAGRFVAEKPEPMETLLAQLVTPGGITELGLEKLNQHGHETIWQHACNSVLERLT